MEVEESGAGCYLLRGNVQNRRQEVARITNSELGKSTFVLRD